MKFSKLTRQAMRALPIGGRIMEHGIRYEKLPDGGGRFSIDIMVNGQRIHRVIGEERHGVTREECEGHIAQAQTDARHGRFRMPKGRKNPMTLAEAAGKYLDHLKQTGGKNQDKKTQHLNNSLVPFFSNAPLERITETEIARYKKHRAATVSGATINRELATLSHLMNTAVDQGWIFARPVRRSGIEPKKENKRLVWLTPAEAKRLLEAASTKAPHVYAFVKIGLTTGMREMEILSIRLEHIDLARKSIFVWKSKTGPAPQPITADLADFLRFYIKKHCKPGDEWLFPSTFGTKAGHRTSIDDGFRACVVDAGLDPEEITPHVMRHTVGTRLSEAGVDMKTRMEWMRHKTTEMALRYDHVSAERIQKAGELLAKSLA